MNTQALYAGGGILALTLTGALAFKAIPRRQTPAIQKDISGTLFSFSREEQEKESKAEEKRAGAREVVRKYEASPLRVHAPAGSGLKSQATGMVLVLFVERKDADFVLTKPLPPSAPPAKKPKSVEAAVPRTARATYALTVAEIRENIRSDPQKRFINQEKKFGSVIYGIGFVSKNGLEVYTENTGDIVLYLRSISVNGSSARMENKTIKHGQQRVYGVIETPEFLRAKRFTFIALASGDVPAMVEMEVKIK